MTGKKEQSIKSRLGKIEQLIQNLESDGVEIEDALESYEKGMELIRSTQKTLNTMEQKVQTLISNQGEMETSAFVDGNED